MSFNEYSFCPELWSQLEITSTGDYKICCLAYGKYEQGLAVDDNGKVMNVMTHSISDAINSQTHKKHRLELMNNQRPERCRNCYHLDDVSDKMYRSTGNSKRQNTINRTAKLIPEYMTLESADSFTTSDGTALSKVVNLHIHFSNLCNMKCLMCSPESSSLWYEDYVLMNNTNTFSMGSTKYTISKDEHNRYKMNYNKWWESDIWRQRFDEIKQDLRYIYFTGGEPFLVPALSDCLDDLIANNLHTEIHLRFDTNLSVINRTVLEKIKKFKSVSLCISVDDVEHRYNLVRFPGNYDTFIKNLETVIKMNIKISYLSSCIGIATLHAMPRVYDLIEKYNLTAEFRFLEGPKWLDIRYLPKSAKEELIKQYNLLAKSTNSRHWYNVMANMLTKFLDETASDSVYVNQFVRNMDLLDSSRNTDWRKDLPDVYEFLKKHSNNKIKNL
jgi:MoaA/NifB/PqqE/SkfB family radical SAM enzyme